MKDKISRHSNGYMDWEGVMGKEPSKTQFLDYFSKEVYIYMGHGAGMAHIKER